jgi:hypothetical protein
MFLLFLSSVAKVGINRSFDPNILLKDLNGLKLHRILFVSLPQIQVANE